MSWFYQIKQTILVITQGLLRSGPRAAATKPLNLSHHCSLKTGVTERHPCWRPAPSPVAGVVDPVMDRGGVVIRHLHAIKTADIHPVFPGVAPPPMKGINPAAGTEIMRRRFRVELITGEHILACDHLHRISPDRGIGRPAPTAKRTITASCPGKISIGGDGENNAPTMTAALPPWLIMLFGHLPCPLSCWLPSPS